MTVRTRERQTRSQQLESNLRANADEHNDLAAAQAVIWSALIGAALFVAVLAWVFSR